MSKIILCALLVLPTFSVLIHKHTKSLSFRSPASTPEAVVVVDKNALVGKSAPEGLLTEDEKKQAKMIADEIVNELVEEQKQEAKKKEEENCKLTEQNKILTDQLALLQNQQQDILKLMIDQNKMLSEQMRLIQEQLNYDRTYRYNQPSQYPVTQAPAFQFLPEQTFGNWVQTPQTQNTDQSSWALAPQFNLNMLQPSTSLQMNYGFFGTNNVLPMI